MRADTTIVVASYGRPESLNVTLSSLAAQTVPVDVIVVDEPSTHSERNYAAASRHCVRYVKTDRHDDWGSTAKMFGTKLVETEFVGHANGDNYYMPPYVEVMSEALRAGADFAHCDMLTHFNLYGGVVNTQPQTRRIDGGGWIARTNLVREFAGKWPDKSFDPTMEDGRLVEMMIAAGAKPAKIGKVLYVHN